MDDILPTFASRYQLPRFPLPLFISELEEPDLPLLFVSRYQLPTFPLPLFVSRSREPIIFTDDFTTTSEVSCQSLKALTNMKSNNVGLNDKLFELNTGSKATKRANQRCTRNRKKGKRTNKLNATPDKPKGTNTSSEEFQDNKITDYFSNLMAQVDASIQAELEEIRNDDYGINTEESF